VPWYSSGRSGKLKRWSVQSGARERLAFGFGEGDENGSALHGEGFKSEGREYYTYSEDFPGVHGLGKTIEDARTSILLDKVLLPMPISNRPAITLCRCSIARVIVCRPIIPG
jgi:hypothetical protein